jgi:N-hydroxyarylamine O-acetyltransferase
MDIEAYLQRINYDGSRHPTAQTLRELQLAHLQSVPFENLSIHAAEPIVLDDDALFDKIVRRRRGGFCYELNGLFCGLLRGLGFRVEMLAAGVANDGEGFGPEFDHMLLLVSLDERWIADVGFGDSFLEPLRLDVSEEQTQGARAYKFIEEGELRVLLQRGYDSQWKPQYSFTLQPHNYPDYAATCDYHQTSPESHFTKGRVCTRATPDGRITLSELRLITTNSSGERSEKLLADEAEYADALREHFGVTMQRQITTPA